MSLVTLDGLTSEVLHGKETAVLIGFSWAALTPQDAMVRLLLVPEGPGVNMQVFMHRLTPLLLQDMGIHQKHLERHESPEELDIRDPDLRVSYQGATYHIAARMTASWSYFCETHEF